MTKISSLCLFWSISYAMMLWCSFFSNRPLEYIFFKIISMVSQADSLVSSSELKRLGEHKYSAVDNSWLDDLCMKKLAIWMNVQSHLFWILLEHKKCKNFANHKYFSTHFPFPNLTYERMPFWTDNLIWLINDKAIGPFVSHGDRPTLKLER